jgi:hypothetical protein
MNLVLDQSRCVMRVPAFVDTWMLAPSLVVSPWSPGRSKHFRAGEPAHG